MKLRINGYEIDAKPGQTLLELIEMLGLSGSKLSERPLAAKIAGEVFNLNYVPVRVTELCSDRPSIRRAMAASGGEVQLLYYNDPSGKDVYERTARFVLFLALENCYPSIEEKAVNLLYFIVKNHSFSDGNKRIGANCFLYFLKKNNLLYKRDKPIIDNATLATITLY